MNMDTKKLNFDEFCNNLLQKFFSKDVVNNNLSRLRKSVSDSRSNSVSSRLTSDPNKLTSYYVHSNTRQIYMMQCQIDNEKNYQFTFERVNERAFVDKFNDKELIKQLPCVQYDEKRTDLVNYTQFTKYLDGEGNECLNGNNPYLVLNTLSNNGCVVSKYIDNNTFMSYLLDNTKEAVKPFLRLLYSYYVSQYCTDIKEIYVFLTIYAHSFQHPNTATPALCFVGTPGSGKSTLAELTSNIVGKGLYFSTSNKGWLTDNFTSYQLKPYCCIEECQNYSKVDMNSIKEKITNNIHSYNEKFEKHKTIVMQQHFIFTSNFALDAFYIEKEDRRYFVMRTEKNPEFATLKADLRNDIVVNRVFMFLMLCDTSLFNEKEELGFKPSELMTLPKRQLVQKCDTSSSNVLAFFEGWKTLINDSGLLLTYYDENNYKCSRSVNIEEEIENGDKGLTFGVGNLRKFCDVLGLKPSTSINRFISDIHLTLIESGIKSASSDNKAFQKTWCNYMFRPQNKIFMENSTMGRELVISLSYKELNDIIEYCKTKE